MNPNEIIIYGFNLGNAHPEFKEYIMELSNNEICDLRRILYEKKLDAHRDGYGRAIYGLDRYGCVDIPVSIRQKRWKETGKELYPFLKDLWVAGKLGYNGPRLHPWRHIEWQYWRALVVTSREEAKEMVLSTALGVGLYYLGTIGFVRVGAQFVRKTMFAIEDFAKNTYRIKVLRASGGKINGFSISRGYLYGAKPRFDFERITGASRETSRLTIPDFLKNRPLPHYHRGKGNNLRYHRPWELGPDGKRRW